MTTRIREIQLPNGRTKKGQTYPKQIQFQPGMESLVNIVAGLQKDVKRINQALTLQGAQKYIENKPNWSAHEEDIVGPDGKPDGIKEVFVADGKGNVKIINGYSLGKSTYPLRKLHRTIYPTRAERVGHPLNGLKRELKEVVDFDPENGPVFGHPLNKYSNITDENIKQFESTFVEITPRNYFKQIFFAPIYAASKESGTFEGLPPMVQAQVYNKALSRAYNHLIRNAILEDNNIDPSMTKKSSIDKLMKQPSTQRNALLMMYGIQQKPEQYEGIQNEIGDIIGATIEEIRSAPVSIEAADFLPDDNNDF